MGSHQATALLNMLPLTMMNVQGIHPLLDCLDRLKENGDRLAYLPRTETENANSNVWPKGTGYGLGSNKSTWNVERTLKGMQKKEEYVTSLFQAMANVIHDQQQGKQYPFSPEVIGRLKKSSLMPILSDYLSNDSVLDMAGHVRLYRTVLELLRSIASVPELRSLLVSSDGELNISKLLVKMKNTVTDYSKLLETSTKDKDIDLVQLIPDIETTMAKVEEAVKEFLRGVDLDEEVEAKKFKGSIEVMSNITPGKTLEERYVGEMKKLQFAYIDMIDDALAFKVPYHFEDDVRKNWGVIGQNPRRLAQELISLSTSLPLSYGSTIFLRCDTTRLDVIKVLITGPAGTPYSNGCFEFDVHFPNDYPRSPPKMKFKTTGGEMIWFNPNLFHCGSICLSILTTHQGRPEERWNPKTSSLLTVLVAIQSMIFVEDPYWNEPRNIQKYAESDKEGKKKKSLEYNAGIQSYTLQYAILDQIRNPTDCFKEVIHRHFWMKKEGILAQCEEWNGAMDVTSALKSALKNMKPPEGLEDLQIVKHEETVPPPVKKTSLENLSLDELMKKLQPLHSVTEPMENSDSVSKEPINTKTIASSSSLFKSEALRKKAPEVPVDSRPTTPVTPFKKKCKGSKKGDKGVCSLQ